MHINHCKSRLFENILAACLLLMVNELSYRTIGDYLADFCGSAPRVSLLALALYRVSWLILVAGAGVLIFIQISTQSQKLKFLSHALFFMASVMVAVFVQLGFALFVYSSAAGT